MASRICSTKYLIDFVQKVYRRSVANPKLLSKFYLDKAAILERKIQSEPSKLNQEHQYDKHNNISISNQVIDLLELVNEDHLTNDIIFLLGTHVGSLTHTILRHHTKNRYCQIYKSVKLNEFPFAHPVDNKLVNQDIQFLMNVITGAIRNYPGISRPTTTFRYIDYEPPPSGSFTARAPLSTSLYPNTTWLEEILEDHVSRMEKGLIPKSYYCCMYQLDHRDFTSSAYIEPLSASNIEECEVILPPNIKYTKIKEFNMLHKHKGFEINIPTSIYNPVHRIPTTKNTYYGMGENCRISLAKTNKRKVSTEKIFHYMYPYYVDQISRGVNIQWGTPLNVESRTCECNFGGDIVLASLSN